jgi:hypothetical protein
MHVLLVHVQQARAAHARALASCSPCTCVGQLPPVPRACVGCVVPAQPSTCSAMQPLWWAQPMHCHAAAVAGAGFPEPRDRRACTISPSRAGPHVCVFLRGRGGVWGEQVEMLLHPHLHAADAAGGVCGEQVEMLLPLHAAASCVQS